MEEILNYFGVRLHYTRELLLAGLILARIMPMVFLTPFMAGQQAPPEVKMSLGVLLSILVWPLARGSLIHDIPISAFPYFLLLMKETFVGFTIGFVNSHIFAVLDMTGRLIDTARGAAMAEVLVPQSNTRATAIGTLYHQLLLVLFIALGGVSIFLEAFFFSFVVIPISEPIAAGSGWTPLVAYTAKLTGEMLLMATVLSAPAVAATFIIDLVFGILNRVAPQLNAYFMAMPVKAMGALILMLVGMEAFVTRLGVYITWSLKTVQKSIELLMRG